MGQLALIFEKLVFVCKASFRPDNADFLSSNQCLIFLRLTVFLHQKSQFKKRKCTNIHKKVNSKNWSKGCFAMLRNPKDLSYSIMTTSSPNIHSQWWSIIWAWIKPCYQMNIIYLGDWSSHWHETHADLIWIKNLKKMVLHSSQIWV